MLYRLGYFVLFFCMLFASATLLMDGGNFNIGSLIGSLLTALVIAAVIKEPKAK